MVGIGFTGSRLGMTDAQRQHIHNYLQAQDLTNVVWAHHGDCIGADHDFHRLIRQLQHPITSGSYVGRVHLHPPDNTTKRAFCDYDRLVHPKPYVERNRDIVDACWMLIAAPAEPDEEHRSGTWTTIRYAKKVGRQRWVINPDGALNTEWSALTL